MKKISLIFAALLILTLTAACGSGGSEEQVPVQSVSEIVGMGALGVAQRFSGVVSVQDPVKIMKNTDMKVGEIYVEEGDEVNEGDALFVYDTDKISLDLEKAKLELEKLQNDIENLQNEKAQLESEKANASQDQQLQYSLEINSKETDILEANYNSQVKQKEIESLEKSLENATVKASVSGRIGTISDGEKSDSQGNVLPLITIVQTNELLVKGTINENNINALTPGMEVIIRSRIDDSTWTGTLSKIDMESPSSTQDTYGLYGSDSTSTSSTYPFTVELTEKDGLMLGQHVYIEPADGDEEAEDVWRLPAWYIMDQEGEPYVWAEGSNGKLEKRSVKLGENDETLDSDSYVIEEGLTLEDKIAFPDESMHEGMTCVDYKEYVAEDSAMAETGGE